jgi:rhodanese-related sulfurtransferase
MSKKHNPGFLKLVEKAKETIKEVGPENVRQRQLEKSNFVLIDTREDREWDQGTIEGAIHLGKGVIERDMETLFPDKGKEYILFCGGGYRSALAALALEEMGYANVFSLAGGIREWKEKRLPLKNHD